MINCPQAFGGMVTAPHHLASQAGIQILREEGNAVEAMLAMAATIAVVYPHMNSIAGDGFWLISAPGAEPVALQACGPAAAAATLEFYRDAGCRDVIPSRGGLAALTVPGTVGGWIKALALAREWGGRMPLQELLGEAIRHARNGIAVTRSQERLTEEKLGELHDIPGFGETYLMSGKAPQAGKRLRFRNLASTLDHLARVGLDDFYRGDVARAMAADLEAAGSPVRRSDLERFEAARVAPLCLKLKGVRALNLPPPTQGIASLMILAILERLGPRDEEAAFIHDVVEATKQAFIVRDREVSDPATMDVAPSDLISTSQIDRMAAAVNPNSALPWPNQVMPGDTVWMGAIDREGRAVSFIQSLYWEFGSGVVSKATGALWPNRGVSFSLAPTRNQLAPGRLPFHTLNPAMARFDDGRTMVYGTMGGDGQPQTQAAIFARYAWRCMNLQQSVTSPRWLLGRTWGSATHTLKLEDRFDDEVVETLRRAGHDMEIVEPYSDFMGHAGALVRHADGLLEGAADPRSDGCVAAF